MAENKPVGPEADPDACPGNDPDACPGNDPDNSLVIILVII